MIPRALFLVLLAFAACALTGERAAAIRAGVIGLQASSLTECLGAPTGKYSVDGEAHQLGVYAYEVAEWTGVPGMASRGGGRGESSTLGVDRPFAPKPEFRSPASGRLPAQADGLAKPEPGTCRLSFELKDGVVASFKAFGWSHGGVPAVDACTIFAERCVEGGQE